MNSNSNSTGKDKDGEEGGDARTTSHPRNFSENVFHNLSRDQIVCAVASIKEGCMKEKKEVDRKASEAVQQNNQKAQDEKLAIDRQVNLEIARIQRRRMEDHDRVDKDRANRNQQVETQRLLTLKEIDQRTNQRLNQILDGSGNDKNNGDNNAGSPVPTGGAATVTAGAGSGVVPQQQQQQQHQPTTLTDITVNGSARNSIAAITGTEFNPAQKKVLKDLRPFYMPCAKFPAEPGSSTGVFTQVQDDDVLFGRGAYSNLHHGNIQYRLLVQALIPEYLAASKRKKKTSIATGIVLAVRRAGGRFLKMEPIPYGSSRRQRAAARWMGVENLTAREKVAQALRNKVNHQ